MKSVSYVILFGVLFALSSFISSCSQQTEQSVEVVYGPYETNYKLPDVPGKIYYVSPNGEADSEGLSLNSPTRIEEAVKKVVTGDAIVMRGGIYRTGNLTFNQGVTFQAYRDEKPVLNGTLVADSWSEYSENVWVTDWDYLFPAGPEDWWNRRNEARTPLHRFNNDAVFIDGEFLQSAGSIDELDEGTYFVDYDDSKIYIGANPTDRFVEVTAFRKAIYRTLDAVHGKQPDKKGPVFRGITFTQYPDTMVHIGGAGLAIDQHGRDIVGTVFENCTFTYCFRIAMFALSDSLVMRNSLVANTNAEGIYVVASNDVLLERNIIENNNIENWTGFYPAAVKVFNQSHRAIVRDNIVQNHPNSNGVWWDVGNLDGVFANNRVQNVAHSGLFFEISDRITVAGNVFEDCDQSIFILNASNAVVYNNTFINSRVNIRRDNRGDQLGTFGWHVTTGPGVEERHGHVFVNNLFYMSEENNRPMLQTGQPANMCERLTEPHLKTFNNNVYVRNISEDTEDKAAIIQWGPYPSDNCQIDIFAPVELNGLHAEFASECEYFENIGHALFVDLDNNNYQLAPEYAVFGKAQAIPANIAKLLGVDENAEPFIGAVAQ